ncbi:MAG: hypothetical protein MPL62_14110, partial [Alphaproteobacteria bacterium]|nr:hypothetical protein [Alphaproteobacteria bacterium]
MGEKGKTVFLGRGIAMQYSIVDKQECAKYDFGFLLFSPDFFMEDKMSNWKLLERKSGKSVADYFQHVKDMVKETKQQAICYDLTDGLPKFLDGGVVVDHIRSAKKVAREGDFVISRLRSYLEEMAIVERKKQPQLFSSEFLVFRKKTEELSVETLFAVCMTNIVQVILSRGQYGTEHPRFYDFLLTNLPIPACLQTIDGQIKNLVQQALGHRVRARKMYADTQSALLTELGLVNWRPKHEINFSRNYSDIQNAGRIDAEYFQPKYKKIVCRIKSYSGGWEKLENFVQVKDAKFMLETDKRYEYIELANIASQGEIAGHMWELGQDLPGRARRQVATGDVIVSSIEGSLSSIALVQQKHDQAVCSTGFHVIKSSELNSETLLLLMQSIVGQLQLKKGCSGTILTAISKDELGQIVLPKIRAEVQKKIRQKVAETFKLRARSKHLLNCAKTAVELA